MKTTAKKVSRTARMFQLVLEGFSNEKAVEIIKKEYGKNVPTNAASIGWCRTQLKGKTDYAKKHNPKNQKVVSDREARAKMTKADKTINTKPKPAAKPAVKPTAKPTARPAAATAAMHK